MPEIVLSTFNAKYIHASFGLRYLMANLGPLQSHARILEFDINQRVLDVAEAILCEKPAIVGLGVYIWNAAASAELLKSLKRIEPSLIVVLGGPEVSHESEEQAIVQAADYTITGEADTEFAVLAGRLLAGERPTQRVIISKIPELSQLKLPYELYTEKDLLQRVVYLEASRGCPFTCEFCLSSLDVPVREFPLEPFLASLQRLLDRGLTQFKFVDRTFNLNLRNSEAILEFLLERHQPGNFYHFELIPDRLPEALREVIIRFPPGALQFEIGIQTFNAQAAELIRRRQNYERLEDNFRYLRQHAAVHLHADLIAGLPGEDLDSFAAGFDRLWALGPQEIQVGILKRLRGTPIIRHDAEWDVVYSPHPPYEILRNRLIDFHTMQRLRRFARFWDLVGNSGNFQGTVSFIWTKPGGATDAQPGSPFWSVMRFSDWIYARMQRTDSIALPRLMELVFEYLTREIGHAPDVVANTVWGDYQRGGRNDKPTFLKRYIGATRTDAHASVTHNPPLPKRQARHRNCN